jgi:hypothetical protein
MKGKYSQLFVEPSMPAGDFLPLAPRVVFDSEAGFTGTPFALFRSVILRPEFLGHIVKP